MNSEVVNEELFNEYRPLGLKHRTRKHNIIIVLHILAAILISWSQFTIGLDAWFYGFGIVTPILLVINGFLFSYLENDSWYKEEMIPYISRIISTTEIETDRLRQYHRRSAWIILVLGWFDILLCQLIWTYGLTAMMPNLTFGDLLMRIPSEVLVWGVLLGPFFLYFIFMAPVAFVLDRMFLSMYNDISHLLDIENKWNREDRRRAEEQKTSVKVNTS